MRWLMKLSNLSFFEGLRETFSFAHNFSYQIVYMRSESKLLLLLFYGSPLGFFLCFRFPGVRWPSTDQLPPPSFEPRVAP